MELRIFDTLKKNNCPTVVKTETDLGEYLFFNNIGDLICLYNKIKQCLKFYLKLFILKYADDTIILSENHPEEFQYLLNIFSRYCKNWRLKININSIKTKFSYSVKKTVTILNLEGSHLEKVIIFK